MQSAVLYFRLENVHSDSRLHRTAVRAAVCNPGKHGLPYTSAKNNTTHLRIYLDTQYYVAYSIAC